ncbi:MAG: SH3 domain-containing protein, partial [Clostridium perfringens]|nr:SH3 domain-containing protein [Clostridium perfringens]
MKKVKMTALIVAATVTIGGYGLLGTSSVAVTNNIVLASSVSTTSTTTSNGSLTSSLGSSSIGGVATGEGVIINGGSSFELLNSPNGNKVSNVSVGEMVTLESGNTNGYYKVEVRETGDVGYLKASNVQEIYNCQNSSLKSLSSQGTIINVSSVVNLRHNAGLNSDILKTLANGQTVTITGKQGQWYRVSVNGETGFIYEEYISLNSNATTTQNTSVGTTTTNVKSVAVSTTGSSSTTNVVRNNSGTRSEANNIKSTTLSTTESNSTTNKVANNTQTTSKANNIISMAVNTKESTSTANNTISKVGSTTTISGTTSKVGSTTTI